ncbi:MAG: LamG domain-containing protein [Phycisphaerae bacterium]|nr:LamG domain-containing protein [Phycisphaerae bacterium]
MNRVLIGMILCLALAVVAHAELLSYEGFDYTEGNIAGQTVTGTGYLPGIAWYGDTSQVVSAGLTYPGLPTSGKAVQIDGDGNTTLETRLDLTPVGPFAQAGLWNAGNIGSGPVDGILYISLLVQASADTGSDSWVGITTYQNGGENMFLGHPWGYNEYGFVVQHGTRIEANIGTPGVAIDVNTHLIVMKIKFNPNAFDDVTFWIDPDLAKSEDNQDASKTTTISGVDMSFETWTYRGVKQWKFDEARFATTWNDVIESKMSAQNPNPAENATGVPSDSALSWLSGDDASPVSYNVYLGGSADITAADLVGNTAATTFSPTMYNDNTYFWRIDSVLVAGSTDPNDIVQGSVWKFETELSLPVIAIGSPADVFAAIGETVDVVINATDPLGIGLDYQWYQGETGDTSNPVGTNSATLEVTIADAAMLTNTYWCSVTNTSGPVNSGTAEITEKLKLAEWLLDSATDPNSTVAATPESWFFLESGSVEAVEGIIDGAVKFNNAAIWTDPAQASYFDPMNEFCTIKVWVKTDVLYSWNAIVSRRGEGQGWQLREVWGSGSAGFTTRGTGADDGSPSNVQLADDQWHQVVGTFDSLAGVKKVYVDGKLAVTDNVSSVITSTISPVALACRVYDDGDGWSVRDFTTITLDTVQLYNYPMTATEIAMGYSDVVGDFCINPNPVDLDGDCIVNLADFALISASWLDCGLFPSCVDSAE